MAPLEIRHRSVRPISAKHAQASRFLQQSLREIVESGNDGPVLMMNLNRYTQEAAVGARILWCTPVFGQAVGTQHIDEILAVWYPTHKTFLDLSDAPGAKESYRLRGACVAYAVIHRCSGSNSPLDGNG
ncbi:hypothetical protein ACFSTI_33825 [Rhizorhabdus histidinilytica]|nr:MULTISPECIES: hypothetical protein [Sphingobium]